LFQEVQPLENAVRPFSIAINAVTPASWAAFIEAVPEWRYENSADLKARGLVNEDYAAETTTATLTGVSWYAAKAYCQWLTASLADSRSEVRLPFEAEWEYGAGSGLLAPGVYEWCEDHYAPFNGLRADSASIEAIGSPERSVRGGPTVEMRASLPPDFCSPFVSFRPVIAQKGTRYE
jgi:formylglycine-generating enzyme required for sulfatase activity